MKLYVAAKYSSTPHNKLSDDVALSSVLRWVEKEPHEITFDWWAHNAVKPFWSEPASNFPLAERMRDGVLEADCLILVVSDGLMGGWIEFGIALASLKPIILVGELPSEHPFTKRPGLQDTRRDSIFELFPCVHHARSKADFYEALDLVTAGMTHHRPSGAPIMINQDLDMIDFDEEEPLIEHTEGAE